MDAAGDLVFGASLIVWFFSFAYLLPVLRERLRNLRPAWFQTTRSNRNPNLDAGRWITYAGQPVAAVGKRARRRGAQVAPSTRRWLT